MNNKVDLSKLQERLDEKSPATEGEYSVVQFFDDGTYEYVRRYVSDVEAVLAAKHYTNSVGARAGLVTRVIITDGGDCTCFDWRLNEGVVFPPTEEKETDND